MSEPRRVRADQLWDDANTLLARKRLVDAAAKTTELLALLRHRVPPRDVAPPVTAVSEGDALGLLALIEHLQGHASRADELFGEALRQLRASAPSNPASLAKGLLAFSLSRIERDAPEEARHALSEALDALRPAAERLEEDAFDLLRAVANRALQIAAWNLAEAALVCGIEAFERSTRPRHHLAGYFSALATTREAAGRKPDALAPAREALKLAKEGAGPYAPTTIELTKRLAQVLVDLGQYAEAQPHLELLVAVAEARAGDDSEQHADAIAAWALALDQTGDYARAEHQYRRALEILRRLRGETHRSVLILRFNLAELARISGDLETAESKFRELEDIEQQRNPVELGACARLFLNLGLTLASLRKYDEAAERLGRARALTEGLRGPKAPQYGRVLLALGQLESGRGAYDRALPWFDQAAAILQGQPGWEGYRESSDLGRACCRLHIEGTAAALAEADAVFGRMVERRGAGHPTIGVIGRAFALELVRAGAFGRARLILERVDQAIRFELVEALKSKADESLQHVVSQLRDFQCLHLSLLLMEQERAPASLELAHRMLANLRGAETTVLRLRGRGFLQSDASAVRSEIQRLKARIVSLELGGAIAGGRDHVCSDLARYRQQLERAEAELARRVGEGRLDLEFLAAPSRSRPPLPEHSALVEFAIYAPLQKGLANAVEVDLQYAAFVISGQQASEQIFELGSAAVIDSLIKQFRQAVVSQPLRATTLDEVEWRDFGAALTRRLVNPLLPSLSSIRRLIVVPEGEIGVLPFGCLPTIDGRFLIDDFEIEYLFSTRTLSGIGFEEDFGVGDRAAVVGAPDFETCAAGPREVSRGSEIVEQLRSAGRFAPLPEAVEECEEIAKQLGVEPLIAARAAEPAVKALRNPEMLHIATHGFFLPKSSSSAGDASHPPGMPLGRRSLHDSLDRAGLAFAGANAHLDGSRLPDDQDDGVLYASEIAGLELTRTDLVTLSACQTGLGDVHRGDGVHGLQRAFTTAGARSVVCSLWEVPDKAARRFFTRFYTEILKPRPRGEAFHAVVQELRTAYPLHPIAWGGFVIYGDARVLSRFDPVRTLTVASVVLPPAEPNAAASPAQQAERLIARGDKLWRESNVDGSIDAYTKAADVAGVPDALRARALYLRGGVRRQSGDFAGALREYIELDRLADVPDRLRAAIGMDRANTLLFMGRPREAIEAFAPWLTWDGLDADSRAKVLVNRGWAYFRLGDEAKAIGDFTAVIGAADAPPDQRAKALLNRSEAYLLGGRAEDAEADAKAVIDGLDVGPAEKAGALIVYGRALALLGRTAEAADSFRMALNVGGIPDRLRQIAEELFAGLSSPRTS